MEDLNARIDAANEKFFGNSDSEGLESVEIEDTETVKGPTDYFQEGRNQARRIDQTKPVQARGSRPLAQVDFSVVQDSALPAQYKKAKKDSEYFRSLGDKQRASIIKQQYMQDYFLPTVDALVRMNSQESILANKQVLDKMDSYALIDGSEGQGYTKTYINTLYAPTGQIERSDGEVRHTINRIQSLIEDDDLRLAAGLAKQLKDNIDKGNNMASTDDYEILEKIVYSVE